MTQFFNMLLVVLAVWWKCIIKLGILVPCAINFVDGLIIIGQVMV